MALRRHPDIPEQTIERVYRLAEEIGYTPDPYLAGLAAYRKRLNPSRYTATIAWLSVEPTPSSWRESRIYSAYYEGACKRASELGYRIEEHILNVEAGNAKHLERILRARNIQGILLPPQPGLNNSIAFDFSRFCAITFGYTLQKPKLHLISHQHFQSAQLAMTKLRALGYHRIGFCLIAETDQRTLHGWSAGVRAVQAKIPDEERLPLLLIDEFDRKRILAWYKRVQPDAILTVGRYIYDILRDARIAVPKQVGYAVLDTWDEPPWLSGINQNAVLTGARALELLVDKLNLREVGVPAIVTQVLVEGTWFKGKTLRSRKRKSASNKRAATTA